MDKGIIISIILGLAGIICSIFFGFIPSFRKRKAENLNAELLTVYKDLNSFYEIENILLIALAELSNKNVDTLKIEYRKIISDSKGRILSDKIKPSNILKKIELLSN